MSASVSESVTPEYVDDRTLAQRTPIARVTWQKYRERGDGPPFMRVGRRCVYRWADVIAWLDAQRVGA